MREPDAHAAPQNTQGSILSLKPGGHVCVFYDDPLEQAATLAPLFAQGLARGERCIYIADDLSIDDVARGLLAAGIDVPRETARDALLLWTRREWRQPGELRSAKKAVQVLGIIEDAVRAGFTGVRFAVEMTWTLDPEIDAAQLRHWEATLDELGGASVPVRIVCQYSRTRLRPEALEAALATHPLAARGADLHPNPHHASAAILDGAFRPRIAQHAEADRLLSAFGWDERRSA